MTTRPFTLPARPTRADCEAYAYLCDRPDVWSAWCRVLAEHPLAPPSSVAVLVRLRRTPIASHLAGAIARIYRASRATRAAA